MNAEPRPAAPQPFAEGLWADQLAGPGRQPAWLWHGYLAPGNVTLLTAQWKSGKTTLLSLLLARLRQGGELAGLAVAPGKAAVLSEESRAQWDLRHRKLGLPHVVFFCRPFRSRPRPAEWAALLDHVADLHGRHGLSLVVVDTLAAFLPGRSEANAATVIDALLPLQRLAERGLSVLLLHHPRKGKHVPGQAARGSGALPAFVNISLEMDPCDRTNAADRRRRLLGFSHHDETPRQLVLELNAEGTEYQVLAGFSPDEYLEHWEHLRLVLENAPDKWAQQQILEEWSDDFPRPATNTLWRWLGRAVELQLLCREGTGRKNDPYLYWLPEQEAKWRADPVFNLMQRVNEEARQMNRQRAALFAPPAAAAPAPAPAVVSVAPAAGHTPDPPVAAPAAPPVAPGPGSAAAPASRPAFTGANADWLRPYLPVPPQQPPEG